MKKLRLNKETVSQLNRMEMDKVKGGVITGICLKSCRIGSQKGKPCCEEQLREPLITP